MNRAAMDRFIDTIEWIAAGFVGIVALNIFISVILRNTLNYAIPDSFDIGRMLLGILIFWGIAATSYRGTHITVDLVYGTLAPRARHAVDLFANLITLIAMAVFAWFVAAKVIGTYADNVRTYDLRLPVWIFYLVAWLGLALSVPLMVGRVYALWREPPAAVPPVPAFRE